MTKRIETWLHSPGIVMLALLVVNVACFGIGRWNCLDRNTWPSWIQGVGSVEAILVAIWVSWHQARSQSEAVERSSADELNALLRSFRDELEFHIDNYTRVAGEAIESSTEGEQLRFTIPNSGLRFATFSALTPKLGLVEDSSVRKQMVTAYMTLNGFVDLLQYNNDLVRRMRESLDSGNADKPQTMKTLTNCGDLIRNSWVRTKRESQKAIDLLSHI